MDHGAGMWREVRGDSAEDTRVTGHVTTTDPGIGFGVQFGELETAQRTVIPEAVQHVLSVERALRATISRCVEDPDGPAEVPVATFGLAG